jgi:hypothetical protein
MLTKHLLEIANSALGAIIFKLAEQLSGRDALDKEEIDLIAEEIKLRLLYNEGHLTLEEFRKKTKT